jgi:hypothetical protein
VNKQSASYVNGFVNCCICLCFSSLFLLTGCATPEAPRTARPTAIRATGIGLTVEEAKENAFRQAIENRVGVLVLAEREIQSYRVLRNEILSYSAGYVDDYTIVSQEQVGKKWAVTADVWVSSSKLTSRIISSDAANGKIDGKRVSDSLNSFVKQKKKEEMLVSKILAGFPENALLVRLKDTELKFDEDRNARVKINFETSWNQGYLDSLQEILALFNAVNQKAIGSVIVTQKSTKAVSIQSKRFEISDKRVFEQFSARFADRQVAVRMKLKHGTKVIHEDCWKLPDTYSRVDSLNVVSIYADREYSLAVTLKVAHQSPAQKILESSSNAVLSIEGVEKCSQ